MLRTIKLRLLPVLGMLAITSLIEVDLLPFVESAEFRGIEPGRSSEAELLRSVQFGRPVLRRDNPRGWVELDFELSGGYRVTVSLRKRIVQSIDVIPNGDWSARETVARLELGDLIPSHALPRRAQIGPTIDPQWIFHRTLAGAIIFLAQTDNSSRVVRVRYPADDPIGDPAMPQTPPPAAIPDDIASLLADIPAEPVRANHAPALRFFGIKPGETTESQLSTNQNWGQPLDRRLVTDSLAELDFKMGKYPVCVAVWCKTVQAIDVTLPAGVPPAKVVDDFKLGERLPDDSIPTEAHAGPAPEPGWNVQQFSEGRVLLFVDTQGTAEVRRIRFFARPRSFDELFPDEDRAVPPAHGPDATTIVQPQPGELTNSIGMRLKLVAAGRFSMGSHESAADLSREFQADYDFDRNEWPAHSVDISRAFYLGVHEVTREEFRQFVQDTNYRTDAERGVRGDQQNPGEDGMLAQRDHATWRQNDTNRNDQEPVIYVSWNDAVAFCRWLSKRENAVYRLPTEAEWEYACRAGTTSRFCFGEDPEQLARYGNVLDAAARAQFPQWNRGIRRSDGYAQLAPVGQFEPNRFGFYDMHGNVWEWVADWYADDYYGRSPTTDPGGPDNGNRRTFRGGCWY
jgi:sulfatase modifying factor 1